MPSLRSPDEDSQPEDLEGCAGGPGFADKPEGSTWVSETKVPWKGRLGWKEVTTDFRILAKWNQSLEKWISAKGQWCAEHAEKRCGQYTMAFLLPLLSVSRNENTLG